MRAKLLILASSIGMLGWGAVLPYQYAYAADTRGWGAFVAAAASSLFSVGALVAAPIAGRLSDRFNPVHVAVVAQLLGTAGAASLIFADGPVVFLGGMLVFGLGLAAAAPAKQVLALEWSSSGDRRKVFAYKFTGEALGMAAGAFLAGLIIDLGRADGLDVGFLMAAAGFALSSAIIAFAGRGGRVVSEFTADAALEGGQAGDRPRGIFRLVFANPALRWTSVIMIAIALGFFAQFESGMPAYGITVLAVDPSAVGIAAAVNCIVIVALQVIVVRLTAKYSAPLLLMAVGGIWVVAWIVLAGAQLAPGVAPALFVMTYGIFAVGETIYSPVLNPLIASLAPKGMVGSTLGAMSALQTAFTAAGPLVAGVLLGAGLIDAFLGMHLALSGLAVFAAWRLHRVITGARVRYEPPTRPIAMVDPVDA
ncbi:MAG: MFS transporter [Agromyces sp.]